ncbi:glycosyltransferase family 39 protein [Rhizomonospora bruguierae]|uniref:glycosyltransferase family 39 protein n=1 Tax=Rhizomonospora bruguierae TaxID=1581705 RepID=UPI001BCB9F33|nr:glycosyltransferase family 39 protein [Micromonospora sp. NBRC 107566]
MRRPRVLAWQEAVDTGAHPTPEDETVVLARFADWPAAVTATAPGQTRVDPPVRVLPGRHAAPPRLPVRVRRWLARAGVAAPPALLVLVLGLVGLDQRRMWGDEYASWYAATLPWHGLAQLLDHVDRALTEYYAFMHVWISVAGDSPSVLRLPSVVGMAGAAGLTALLGRRLAGTPAGLLAGGIFALLPTTTRYAQETRPYAFVIAGALLATLLLLRAIDRPVWPRWIAYAIGMVVLGWLHLVALLLVAGHAAFVWRAYRAADRDVRLWKFLGALALVFAAATPLAVSAHGQADAIGWIRADPGTVRDTPGMLFGTGSLALLIVGLGLLAPLVAAGHARRATLPLAAWAVLPPLLTYVTFPLLHLFLYRYVLFTLPAWSLLAAMTVVAAGRLPSAPAAGRRALLVAAAAAVTLALVVRFAAPGQERLRSPVPAGEPDLHGAAAIVAADQHPGDAISFGGTFRHPRTPFRYELRGPHPADVFLAPPGPAITGYQMGECPDPVPCLGDHRRLWLVTTTFSQDPFADMPGPRSVLLRRDFTIVADHRLRGVRVLLLVRAGRGTP